MSAPGGPSEAVMSRLRQRHNHWIAGRPAEPASRRYAASINPADGSTIGKVADGDAGDVNQAVLAARTAFDDKRWRGLTPDRRAQVMFAIAERIEADAALLAHLETLDAGKLYNAALNGEVPMAARAFRYYAGWCDKLGGETFTPSLPAPFHAYTKREPVGVAGLITPWNGPLVMAAWKLAPALAAGCACVLKPSEFTALSTLRLAELCAEAGLPDGVVNIVCGAGEAVGAPLVAHAGIDKIAFTGSTNTGRRLVREVAGDLTRISLELGGKSPVLIFADADIDAAIAGAADAIFAGAGQVCVAGSRLFVERPVYERVLGGVCDIAGALRVGAGYDPAAQMGPLISQTHRERVLGYVARGEADGATRLIGGEAVGDAGFFMSPCVFAHARPGMAIYDEEIFGPVLCVAPFDSEEEALARANDCRYGLAASVWTEDTARAHRCVDALQAGIVWVNAHGAPDMAMPTGGVKQSGWGRENARAGLDLYTEIKSVMMRTN